MKLYRLTEVTLPARRIEPGTYAAMDGRGLLLTVELSRAMSSADLADVIEATEGKVRRIAA